MRERDQIRRANEKYILGLDYIYCHYKQFDYSILKHISYLYPAGVGRRSSYNDAIIMVDTETSKKAPDEPYTDKDGSIKYRSGPNHIVAWTISIRAYHHNICTLYGRKPSSLSSTMHRIHMAMPGMTTIFYIHNLPYDHYFMRRFWYRDYDKPISQLNVKPHYPIYIEFGNGIIIKDSLILAQKKLEKWADDLDVEHKKEVGLWDYDKLRDQDTPLSDDEKAYIEHDTLAGVECLDKTMQGLNKKLYSLPYTATGIPREQTRKRGKKKAHEYLKKIALSYPQYIKANTCYHGGYTHGNRHYVGQKITQGVTAYDFASSYPYILLCFKFASENFVAIPDCKSDFILKYKEQYAFMFKFTAINIRLKSDDEVMPYLQFSKCIKSINAVNDNGRTLCANYVEIYLTEWDLAIIADQYEWDKHICTEVERAAKDYLPRWFTDYVYECFSDKCNLKGGDKILYSIAKARVNSLYGMCCQRNLRNEITEDYDTGEYTEVEPDDPEAKYNEYINKVSTVLPYIWGVTTTAAAAYNVHQLAKCFRIPLYIDTDSCYGIDPDIDAINKYNEGCREKLRANNYEPVNVNGREYWLGVAEHDGLNDEYTEFKFMGAKRYCGRCKADGKLHITVAGVPKKNGALTLEDNIDNFHAGFIFDGIRTGKKTHLYFPADDIYIDDRGNETGDSISLIPCDYKLDSVFDVDWQKIFNDEVEVKMYYDYDD